MALVEIHCQWAIGCLFILRALGNWYWKTNHTSIWSYWVHKSWIECWSRDLQISAWNFWLWNAILFVYTTHLGLWNGLMELNHYVLFWYWWWCPWTFIKMMSYYYWDSDYKDETFMRSSLLYNGKSYPDKFASSFWIGPQVYKIIHTWK